MTNPIYFQEQKSAEAVQVNTSVPGTLGEKPLGRFLADVADLIK